MAILLQGSTDFVQIGQPRWIPGRFLELDALELTFQGAYSKLATYRATLSKWKPSTLDSNMRLESYPDDGDLIQPKVTLRYIGCKGGVLPVSQSVHGKSLQTANYSREETSLDVLYRSPHTTVRWIDTSASLSRAGFSNPDPDIEIVLLRSKGVSLASYPANWRDIIVNQFFTTETRLIDPSAEEIVPGRYWMCSATTAKTLEPR